MPITRSLLRISCRICQELLTSLQGLHPESTRSSFVSFEIFCLWVSNYCLVGMIEGKIWWVHWPQLHAGRGLLNRRHALYGGRFSKQFFSLLWTTQWPSWKVTNTRPWPWAKCWLFQTQDRRESLQLLAEFLGGLTRWHQQMTSSVWTKWNRIHFKLKHTPTRQNWQVHLKSWSMYPESEEGSGNDHVLSWKLLSQ